MTEPAPDAADVSMHLTRWEGSWDSDDPDAGFKAEVALFSLVDPLPALEVLSDGTGIPVGALLRFIAAKYMTAGSEALLEVGASQIEEMLKQCHAAEAAGTDTARLDAYERIRGRLGWLVAGLDPPDPRAGWNR